MKGVDKKKVKKWMYTPKKDEQFFFIHVPKTGGTTLRRMMTNHFPEASYYPTQKDLLNNKGKYLNQKELVDRQELMYGKSLIMGHYTIELIDHLKPNVKTIAFFRNPVDRVISHIKHIIAHDEKWKGADPNDVIERRIKYLGGAQTRMINDSKSKNLNDMLKNINKLDFVGILENFDESVAMLNDKFNWKCDLIKKENVGKSELDRNITAKSMALICRNIKLDIIIFDHASELFQKRYSKFKKIF